MTIFWILLSLFPKLYFLNVPIFFHEIIFWVMFGYCFWKMRTQGYFKLQKIYDLTVFRVVVISTFTQLTAMCISVYLAGNSVPMPSILQGIVHYLELVTTIFMTYTAISFSITDEDEMIKFFKSDLFVLAGFELLVLLPQIVATMTRFLDPWVNFIAGLFENREALRPDFYWNGSYVASLLRVNGFQGEASFLAAQLALVFLPFSLAAIKNHVDYFDIENINPKMKKYWIVIVVVIVTLFFAKTTTGFLIIGITMLLLLFIVNNYQRYLLVMIMAVGIFGLGVGYFWVPSIHQILQEYLFQKQNTSNRLGNSIGLLLTFLHHPIIGVGQDFTNYFTFEYVPMWTRNNTEFLQHILPNKSFAPQSVLGAFFAENGLIITVPILVYIYNRVIDAHSLMKRKITKLKTRHLTNTVVTSFYIFLLLYLVLSFFSFRSTDYSNLVMFFFFVRAISILKSSTEGSQSINGA